VHGQEKQMPKINCTYGKKDAHQNQFTNAARLTAASDNFDVNITVGDGLVIGCSFH
jgi:hypothetical protein